MGRSDVRPHSHQRKCHSGYCSDFCEGKVGIEEEEPLTGRNRNTAARGWGVKRVNGVKLR